MKEAQCTLNFEPQGLVYRDDLTENSTPSTTSAVQETAESYEMGSMDLF